MGFVFINNIPEPDPEVKYNGKVYPQDRVPLESVPVDPNVNYNGGVYPRDRVPYTPPPVDPTNQPSVIIIAGLQLPPDTIVMLDGMKIITRDPILDGVVVYEHISRHPYEIEFDIVIREQGAISGFNTGDVIPGFNLVSPFPQQALNKLWKQVWIPDTVVQIQNTYLNGLGILEIIIEKIKPATVRGSKNIPIKMTALENIPGQSLIMTTNI